MITIRSIRIVDPSPRDPLDTLGRTGRAHLTFYSEARVFQRQEVAPENAAVRGASGSKCSRGHPTTGAARRAIRLEGPGRRVA
jgi:hypothetical protein